MAAGLPLNSIRVPAAASFANSTPSPVNALSIAEGPVSFSCELQAAIGEPPNDTHVLQAAPATPDACEGLLAQKITVKKQKIKTQKNHKKRGK